MIVYRATNRVNGKQYVGQTVASLKVRADQHRWAARNPKTAFSHAIAKHGWESFDWEILQRCSEDELDAAERYWIAECGSLAPNGYNLETGGSARKRHNPLTIAKMSASQKRRSPESRAKQAASARRRYEIYREEENARFAAIEASS